MTYSYAEYLELKLAEAHGARKTARTEIRIEIAVASLLAERAYHSVTVNQITERANLAHGTFYRYFADKREIVARTLSDYFEFVRTTQPKTLTPVSDEELIGIANRHYVRCFRENVGLMRCHFHLKDEDELIAEIARKADRHLSNRMIRKLTISNPLPASKVEELRLCTFALIGMVDEFLLRVYGQIDPPLASLADEPDLIADTLTRMWNVALQDYRSPDPERFQIPSLSMART